MPSAGNVVLLGNVDAVKWRNSATQAGSDFLTRGGKSGVRISPEIERALEPT